MLGFYELNIQKNRPNAKWKQKYITHRDLALNKEIYTL